MYWVINLWGLSLGRPEGDQLLPESQFACCGRGREYEWLYLSKMQGKLHVYRISSIKRPGVYFFRGEIYPAFKRGRRLYGAGVYFSLLEPAPYKLHWIDTELRRSCLLWSCFGHIHSLQLHRYIIRSLALRWHQAHARRVGGRHLRSSTNRTTWTLPRPSVWPGV